MHPSIRWKLIPTTGKLKGRFNLTVGECCIARIVPTINNNSKLFRIFSLESEFHNRLFTTPGTAALAVVTLINKDY